jgi:hypothetical protein
VSEGVDDAVTQLTVPLIILPTQCRLIDPGCGFESVYVHMGVFDQDGEPTEASSQEVATRLAEVLTNTRTQATTGRAVEPIGVTINYKVELTGFRGRILTIRWSLYRAAEGVEVPPAWLKNQPVRWLEGEAERDSASDSFWVPLPKVEGPFFVRVTLHDEKGVRLDHHDSEEFR